MLVEDRIREIQSIHLLVKPRCCRRPSKKRQFTVSNALAMSTLMSAEGILLQCKKLGRKLHRLIIFMNESGLNKCALVVSDEAFHVRCKPTHKYLGELLGKAVNQAYQPVIFLWWKHPVSCVGESYMPSSACRSSAHQATIWHG